MCESDGTVNPIATSTLTSNHGYLSTDSNGAAAGALAPPAASAVEAPPGEKGIDGWQIMASVCVTRHPVICPPMKPIEHTYSQVSHETILASTHLVRHILYNCSLIVYIAPRTSLLLTSNCAHIQNNL